VSPVARLLTERPRLVATIVVGFCLAAVFGVARLGFDANVRNVFRDDDQRMAVLEQIYDAFGSDDNECVVLLEAEDILDPVASGVVRSLDSRLSELTQVESVLSIADVPVRGPDGRWRPLVAGGRDAAPINRESALAHPLLAGRLLSSDGAATLMLVRLGPGIEYLDFLGDPDNAVRQAIDETIAGTPVRAWLTGVPVIRAEILAEIQREQLIFTLVGGALGAIVAFLLFGSIGPTIVVSAAAGVGALWTIGLMGLVGEPINPVNLVVPTLVLIIGFTDAVHMVHTVRRRMRDGRTPREAAADAVRLVGPACALTSVTTAIGFASLAAARLDVVERFGITAAVGALMSFAAVITVVPLLAGGPLGRYVGNAGGRRRAPRGVRDAGRALVRAVIARPRSFAVVGVAVTIMRAKGCPAVANPPSPSGGSTSTSAACCPCSSSSNGTRERRSGRRRFWTRSAGSTACSMPSQSSVRRCPR